MAVKDSLGRPVWDCVLTSNEHDKLRRFRVSTIFFENLSGIVHGQSNNPSDSSKPTIDGYMNGICKIGVREYEGKEYNVLECRDQRFGDKVKDFEIAGAIRYYLE